jgi:hypothetical protein
MQPIANNDVNDATADQSRFSPIERETETNFNDALASAGSLPPQSPSDWTTPNLAGAAPSTDLGLPAAGSGAAPWPRFGPGLEVLPSNGSLPNAGNGSVPDPSNGSVPDASPQLTGNVQNDFNTLAQMVAGPRPNIQAVQAFGQKVEGEAESAGDPQVADEATYLVDQAETAETEANTSISAVNGELQSLPPGT